MDSLSIFIIVISVVLAVVFKWVLIKRIKAWILTDFIKSLASNDQNKLNYLNEQRTLAEQQGLKGKLLQEKLQALADQYSVD